MNTEIFIEGKPLDVSADIASLLTFAIDDVKDFSSRQTTFSKTVVLPGTANNNALFGNIFDTGQANAFNSLQDNVGYNFNAAKSARCLIFQDQLQAFKGTLRLLEIIKDKGSIEYEVALNGELTTLNVRLSSRYLTDLDFSAYDVEYAAYFISISWDNPGGSGVYFPLIDYGTYSTGKHHWDIHTFRPALYVKEYIDKMFTAADFRYTCALFNTARFTKLIVPHNQKHITKSSTTSMVATTGIAHLDIDTAPSDLFAFITATLGFFTANINKDEFTYNQSIDALFTLAFNVTGTVAGIGNPNQSVEISILKNGVAISTQTIPSPGHFDPFTFALAFNIQTNISLSDIISIQALSINNLDSFDGNIDSFTITTTSAIPVLINPGDTIEINGTIPKNVRQIDFLVSIVKLFNLYVYESQFDERLILITPFIDFYSTDATDAVDWTYKLNRDQPIKIKPLSELNSKIYNFNYKDDSDYFNDLYKKRYNQGYGSHIFDSEFEFVSQTSKLELVFAATPLVGYVGEDKVYPTIFKRSGTTEETIDSVIRIMQSKKVMGVTLWKMLFIPNDTSATLGSYTYYGYAGHFDDPDSPVNDLNFGVLSELFFSLVTGNLTNTQFNVYWSAYMAEITSKDSKMLTGKFYLTPKDIFDLNFARYVFLDGVIFRLNKITDYNASQPSECQVELLKVINTTYSFPPFPDPGDDEHFLLWTDNNPLIDSDLQEIEYE